MTIGSVRRCLLLAALLLVFSLPGATLPAGAQGRSLSLIRDAEIETTIRLYSAPLFEAAHLDPQAVQVMIVNDRSLNAFVAGGQRIFINTGLLMAAATPNQLIGVIAHETGHIVGGHLARTQEALENASVQAILAMVLGGVAAAAGAGQAAGAIIAGGTSAAQQSFLRYSRAQESVADQAAVRLLDATGQSPKGLMDFMAELGNQELLVAESQDPYVRTHPISQERVEALRAALQRSRYADAADAPGLRAKHERMRAKLFGYLNGLEPTLRKYPESDTSLPARYARAIAYHQGRQSAKALAAIDGLIAELPDDPYFEELKGQVLLESQRIEEAIPAYARAVELLPGNALLRLGLGQAQVSSQGTEHLAAAVGNLRKATELEPDMPEAWRHLATAYARDGQEAMAALATAERYALYGQYRDVGLMAARAKRGLQTGTPAYLRAEDLAGLAKNMLEREDR